MKITMLGTGAALPDPDRGQSAILLTLDDDTHYLFDCGEGATRQMVRANVDPAKVGFVFLTHLHHDHICDYPYFVISSWMLNKTGSPLVLGPKGTRHFVDHLFENGAYHTDYQARSAYPVRQANLEAMRPEVREVSPGPVFDDGRVRISVDWVEHIPRDVCECFGVRVEAEGKVIAFSGDTAPCEAMVRLAQDADLLIHECTFPESFIAHRAKTGVGTYAHTSPTDLGIIASRAGVKSLVATHFGHFDSTSPVIKRAAAKHLPVELMGPHLMDEIVADIRKNYTGPLRLAHDLMRIDL
ncbi:MBL fold hydrolase [Achromobacter insolitus]|uniref:MBL fold metallo-hydrolase n=1 Tax=Achromobacter insolitus TaxID=217204 RepID=UPI0007C757E2|nr:MBL fold metallo-hydrolase [Achromobacter insolitus]OAE53753.1 MBL fold hydrolase [Achromobacter insolitus]OCZ60902.1 MBL fold hydrolase [Achromobacter insolitus]GLK96707.1 metal-dependent hydrolase [Achromobacter xylosoxidans]